MRGGRTHGVGGEMVKRIGRIAAAVLLFVVVSMPVFAAENWMSTTFQYEHVFNTALRADTGADSLGVDVAWHSFMDNSFAGFFARTDFLFSIDNPSGTDITLFRINLLTGPAFKVNINRMLTWYAGFGPFLSQATTLGSSSGSETLLGAGVDTGLRISLFAENTSGLYLVAGVTGSCNFLNITNNTVSNRITGQIIPYIGFCFSYTTYPYNSYYVYNPLLWP